MCQAVRQQGVTLNDRSIAANGYVTSSNDASFTGSGEYISPFLSLGSFGEGIECTFIF